MKISVKEIVIFGMLGAIMNTSKLIMEIIPNVHLLGVFTIALTVVYRKKALYPIYVFVLLNGLIAGFSLWWVPYLYVWTILWGVTMLLPQNMSLKVKPIVYMCLCGIHGLMFGLLYAPAQALFFGLDFKATIAWMITGLPWDLVHGVSNFFCGMLIIPIISILRYAEKYTRY